MWTIVAFVALFINVLCLAATVLAGFTIRHEQRRTQFMRQTMGLDAQTRSVLLVDSIRRLWIQFGIGLTLVVGMSFCTWRFFTLAGLA